MAEFKHDERSYAHALLDTPFRGKIHASAKTAEEAACMPGNAVKSIDRDIDGSGFPMYHGVLVSYTDDRCIVRSHNDGISERFVWEGTNEEYHKMWVVD